MKARREKQQHRITNGVPYRFTCCHGIEDGKKVNESKIAGRNSPNCVHCSTKKGSDSYVDFKKKDKLNKANDSELCTRQEEVASFGESSNSRNANNPTNPSEQYILKNLHVEGTKSLSEMLNFGVEECKRRANSLGRTNPLPDFKSFPRLPRYREHGSVTEGMKNDNNYHQILIRTKLGLRKEGGNSFFSSSGPKTNDSPEAIVKIHNEKLQIFGSGIRIRKSPHGHNIHAHYDNPRAWSEFKRFIKSCSNIHKNKVSDIDMFSEADGGFKDTPTQNFDINNALGGNGTFMDSFPKSHVFSFSQEVASSSPSPSQRIVDNINMRNRIQHPSTEPVFEHFTKEDVTNSKLTLFKPDKSAVEVLEGTHLEDLIRPSLGLINNLTSSKDILHYVMEILHTLSIKWDEIFMKYESSNQMLDLSTFDELNGVLTSQLSSNKVLVHCVIETLMEVHKNNGFPPKRLDIEAYVVNIVVEKDLAKCGSWLNIKVGNVLEKMVLEIVYDTL
ncbi:unnamed protein product [Lupinus luteus]|uniref:DUF4378 domain-containing protein n=1 Tax=Lupinus luteus TaxID=3873 RepID=A0AAV1WWG2_LUPLU